MGADSAVSTERRIDVCRDPKVFANGELLIGFVGPVRVGQVLREMLDVPPLGRAGLRRYLVAELVPAIRTLLQREGCLHALAGDALAPGWLLVGVRRQLYRVCGDFQIGDPIQGYEAIGAGASYALGSLHATAASGAPKARLIRALEAAEAFTPSVRRPFTTRVMKATS